MKTFLKTKVECKASTIFSRLGRAGLECGMVLWLCVPLTGLGQSSEDFRFLIFEPAAVPEEALQAESLQDSEETQQAQSLQDAAETQQQDESPIVGSVTPEADTQALPTPATQPAPTSATAEMGEQSDDGIDLQNEISRYENALNEELQNQDQYSPVRREHYETLGDLLQRNGEHERAVTMFESAMHIDRINNGLFTTLQIPLVKQIIESQEALGNVEEVADLQGYLYYIHQKAFPADSEELLAAKEAWADWNVASYVKEGGNGLTGNYSFYGMVNSASRINEYVPIQNPRTGEFSYVPRNQLPFILSPGRTVTDLYAESSAYAVTPDRLVDERLRTAEDLYEEILETRAAQTPDPKSTAVQHKLANIAFAIKRQMDVLESQVYERSLGFNNFDQAQPNLLVRRGYSKNLEALETIAQDLENSPDASPAAKATAYIHIGDWNVSFDRPARGEEAYLKAWQLLRDAGLGDAEIAGIFHPQPLLPVPAYAIHEFSKAFYGFPADAELEYKGHIDTTVDLDRFGELSNIRIGATSADTTRGVRDTLLTYLRNKKMRPSVVNGELVKVSDIKTRYYYSYE